MKLTLESTDQLVRIEELPRHPGGYVARVWRGRTEKGIEVAVFVASVRVASGDDTSQFEKELVETLQPAQVVPLRMIL